MAAEVRRALRPGIACVVGVLFLGAVALRPANSYAAWQAIIGIPEPPFGVNEIAPATPSPWTSNVAGFYYVQAGGTNPGNGYPGNPRGTIPNPIPAGSVVEIHGQYNDSGTTYTAQGTSTSPVFIRSASYAGRSKITGGWTLAGRYLIVENLWFAPLNSTQSDFGVNIYEGSDHIAIRNCEFSGNNQRAGGIGVGSWGYSGSGSASYIVVDNCYIHDLGGAFVAGVDTDAHGVTINGSVDHFWLTNSEMTNCAGDGIQIEAQSGRRAKIHHIYVGRNRSHHNKQSGMWIKNATDVIFSENDIWDIHIIDSYSSGQGIGWQYDPEYVWLIFNKIHDCDQGIAVESADLGPGTHTYIIGNAIWNIQSTDQSNPHNYGAIKIRQSARTQIVNNTVYNYDCGLSIPYGDIVANIVNNIWWGKKSASCPMFYVEGTGSTFSNNVMETTSFKVDWNGGTLYNSLSSWQSGTGKCTSKCYSANPMFSSAVDNNFVPLSGSPAIDTGAVQTAYADFLSRYGMDIAKDLAGNARPAGSAWDIGAFEAGAGAPAARVPNPPSGVQVN